MRRPTTQTLNRPHQELKHPDSGLQQLLRFAVAAITAALFAVQSKVPPVAPNVTSNRVRVLP